MSDKKLGEYEEIQDLIILAKTVRPLLHDLSVPATTLQGALSLIDYEKLKNSQEKEAVNIARKSLGQMIRIINNGKSVLQKDTKVEYFYPHKIISLVYTIFKSEVQRYDIRYICDLPWDVKLTGDKIIFERIVMNLLTNSIEELSRKDYIGIIEVEGKIENNNFFLTFKDNGGGIKHYILDKMFSLGVSTKSVERGFGLYFVKKEMQRQFNGDVRVFNSNNGVRFLLKFPL